jgi:hypothetical protein
MLLSRSDPAERGATGRMPVFDDDASKLWDERLFTRDATLHRPCADFCATSPA